MYLHLRKHSLQIKINTRSGCIYFSNVRCLTPCVIIKEKQFKTPTQLPVFKKLKIGENNWLVHNLLM